MVQTMGTPSPERSWNSADFSMLKLSSHSSLGSPYFPSQHRRAPHISPCNIAPPKGSSPQLGPTCCQRPPDGKNSSGNPSGEGRGIAEFLEFYPKTRAKPRYRRVRLSLRYDRGQKSVTVNLPCAPEEWANYANW